MQKIGVTGGIGSGKTLVCRIFNVLGIPVFNADKEAKRLMTANQALVTSIRTAFGEQAYSADGELNNTYLANTVFNDKAALDKLNALVHPVVIRAGEDWANAQHTPYTIKEAALLFESGSYKNNDYNILVTAPAALRIKRVMVRDGVTASQVQRRMDNQWSDDEKAARADFTIINDGVQALIPQVLKLHQLFLSRLH